MAKSYTKELQEKIEGLEDNFDFQVFEICGLQNELKDNLKPNILLSEFTQLILQMLIEYAEFTKKKGETDGNKRSKHRLIKLLDISFQLSGIGDQNQSLKLMNRELIAKIQLLRVEKSDFKRQIDNIIKAENF